MTAEISLAGAILIDPEAFRMACDVVTAEDFTSEACRAVFVAASTLAQEGQTIDPVSIQAKARHSGTDLSLEWLKDAMNVTPTAANARMYAQEVAEAARVRRVKDLACLVAEKTAGADELIADLQRGVDQIRGQTFSSGLLSPEKRIHGLFDGIVKHGASRFVPTGYSGLDSILGGGLICGGLYIIGARPAVGKTTFALNLADKISGNILFISLEMSAEAIAAKQFAKLTGYSAAEILTGAGGDDMWQKLAAASQRVIDSGIFLNARFDLTPGQLQLLAQSVPDLKAVVVDYLGLLLPAAPTASAYERISAISRELKRMALQLNVPVICLAQLSRSVESRADKRPVLSDLRDSGAIEQDADAVMFLYRDDYYKPELSPGGPSLVELSVAKNRHGALGTVEFSAFLKSGFFREERMKHGGEA